MGLSAGCLLHKGCGSGLGGAAPAGALWGSSSSLLKHAEGFSRSALFCGKCRAFESQLFSWVAANKLSQIRMWFQSWSLCIEHLPARLPGLCHLPQLQLRDIYNQTSRKHISLGVCQRELGLEPPLMSLCDPPNTAALTQPWACSGGLARGPILPPHSPWVQSNTDAGSGSFCPESVGGVSSALSFPLSPGCGQGPAGRIARTLWLCCGVWALQCHQEPPETMRALTQLSLFFVPKMSWNKTLPECSTT